MEEMKLNIDQNRFKLYSCMFFVTLAAVGFGSVVLGYTAAIVMRNVIACIFSMGAALVVLLQSDIRRDYMVDSDGHPERLTAAYIICLLLVTIMSTAAEMILPKELIFLFPYMSAAVLFTLLSNYGVGTALYIHFMMVAALLNGFDTGTAFMYLLSGIIGCCIARSAEKSYSIWRTVGSMLGQYIVLYVAYRFLEHMNDYTELWWFGGGILVNFCVLYILLHLFERKILHKYDSQYEKLNDPEHALLTRLKEHSKHDYYNAVHTAYLSDHVARLLEGDYLLAKAGGYYHKIGVLMAKNHVPKSMEIGNENDFPEPLLQLIHEYTGNYETPKTMEAVIVMLSDAIVSSIIYMYEKNPEQKLDYDKIIEAVFKKKYESGVLQDSGISLRDLFKMKEYYKSEALYYDFLR